MKRIQICRGLAILGCLCWFHAADAAVGQNVLNTPQLGIAQEMVIDAERENLENPTRVFVSRTGRVAIWNPGARQIVVFDSSGQRAGSYGRPGDGPGEFTDGGLIVGGWVGDTLWIRQGTFRAANLLIDPQMQLLREARQPLFTRGRIPAAQFGLEQSFYERILGARSTSSFLAAIDVDPHPSAVRANATPGTYIVMMDLSGVGERLVTFIPWSPARFSVYGAGGVESAGTFPLAAAEYVGATKDAARVFHVVQHMTGPNARTFSITAISSEGERLFTRHYPFEWEPIPLAERDRVYQAFYARAPAALRGQLRELAPEVPAYQPVLGVEIGSDHSIWLRLRSGDTTRHLWLVMDKSGNPVGHLVLESDHVVRAVSLGQVWVTRANQDGLSSLYRFRVTGR